MKGRFKALNCERIAWTFAWTWAGSRRVAIDVSWVVVVDGQVRLGDLQLEQVGPARELQGSGLGADALSCGQDVGDVLGAEGAQLQPVVQGAHDAFLAVQLGQGEDLAQVHADVYLLGFE